MPVYEYRAEEDGEIIELIRPMSGADEPVQDPEGKGRTFTRVISVFASTGGAGVRGGAASGASSSPSSGGCCPCGKGASSCSRG